MKRLEDELPGRTDPTPLGIAAVHVMNAPPSGPASTRAEPLTIEYSSTQVVPEALLKLQRTHGVVQQDRSALAESFKMLRNQVLQRMRAEGHTLIAITSPRSTAGKSLTAVNLALTIAADYDSAVLLVDADLGGQGLQTLFGLGAAPGLGEHLMHGTPVSELLVNPGIPRLVLLPAGRRAVLSSSELLATRAAQQSIREMKARYQDRYVIVDLPPLLDTADAIAFLPQVDTTLLVVEEHTTSVEDIERSAELLAPFALIGTVLSPALEPADAPPQPPAWRRWFGAGGQNRG